MVEDRDLVRDPARALEAVDHDQDLALVADPDLDLVALDLNPAPDPNPALDPNLEVDLDQLIAMGIPRKMVIVTDPDHDPAPNQDLNLDLNLLEINLDPNLLEINPNPNLEVDPGPNPEMTKTKQKRNPHSQRNTIILPTITNFREIDFTKKCIKKTEPEPFSYTIFFCSCS